MGQNFVIITAGGTGVRMGAQIPKQFIELSGLPIIFHTIKNYYSFDPSLNFVVTLPPNEIDRFTELIDQHKIEISIKIAEGGTTRFQSVKNGLQLVEGNGVVAIHDAVRPFVTETLLKNCFQTAADKGNAIAAVTLKESIREVGPDEKNRAVDRTKYRIMQTPQCFQIPLIKKAFDAEEKKSFTDDATVLEAAGYEINLVEGDYQNIKITTPEDLIIAESILKAFKTKA